MKKLLTIMCAAMGVAAFGEIIEGARVGAITGENWGYMNQYGGCNVYVFTNTAEEISVKITKGGSAELFIVGGGGSGGNVAGGGGQGGEVVSRMLDTLNEGTYTIKVGAGGLQGWFAGHNYSREWQGANGMPSSFGELITAEGGAGGGGYGSAGAMLGGAGAGGSSPDVTSGGPGIASSILDGMTEIIYGAGGGSGRNGGGGIVSGGSAWAGYGGNGHPDTLFDDQTQGGHGVDGTGSGGGGGGWWADEYSANAMGGGNGGNGIVVLKVNTFDFSDNAADVICTGISEIGATFAMINYQVVDFGDGESAMVKFEFGTESGNYTKSVVFNTAAGAEALAKEVRLFAPATKYYARLNALGDGTNAEVGYSTEFSFTTHAAPPIVASITGNYTINEYGRYRAYVFEDVDQASKVVFSRGGDIDFLMVAGGGAGGVTMGGGGGAGEMKVVYAHAVKANSDYTVTIGRGGGYLGVGWGAPGGNGGDTSFDDYFAKGGGGGGSWYNTDGRAGGSSGGSTGTKVVWAPTFGADGHPGFGNYGAGTNPVCSDIPGGGGGAGGMGEVGDDTPGPYSYIGGNGGVGLQNDFATGEMQWYAAGGGGGCGNQCGFPGKGGSGIGGNGGDVADGYPGKDGTGSGGGGSRYDNNQNPGGNGGSGVFVMRFAVDTTDAIPDISLLSVSDITAHSATFAWDIYSIGAGDAVSVELEYGTTKGLYSSTATLCASSSAEAGSFTFGNLSEGTTYYARLKAVADDRVTAGYTSGFTFTTETVTDPIKIAVGGTTLTGEAVGAKLTFDEMLAGGALYVASGADAAESETWNRTTLDGIGAEELARTQEFDITEGDKFYQFIAVVDTVEYYSPVMAVGDAVVVSLSDPVINTDFTLDGTQGDKIIVSGALESTGGGETASVSLEIAENELMIGAFPVELGEFGVGEIIGTAYTNDTESTTYIKPGQTYYARLVAVGESGSPVYSAVKSVTTLGASAVAYVLGTSVEQTAMHITANMSSIGVGGTATAKLYAGPVAGSLVEVDTIEKTEPGEIAFDYTNATFGVVYVQIKVFNECSTKTLESATEVKAITLTDTTTWYIENKANVNWSDPATWRNSWGTPGVNVGNGPNSSTANVVISTDDTNTPVKISLAGEQYVNNIVFETVGMTVLIEGTEKPYTANESILHVLNCSMTTDQNITFKNTQFLFTYGNFVTFPIHARSTVTLDGAKLVTVNETHFDEVGATLILKNDSYFFNNYWRPIFIGDQTRIVIDNSTFVVGDSPLEFRAECGSVRIEFHGDHPHLYPQTGATLNYSSVNAPEYVFYVPEDGYTEAPFGLWSGVFAQSSNMNKITVAPDSPLRKNGKSKAQGIPLVYSQSGFITDAVSFAAPRDCTVHYDTNGQTILLDYEKKGLAIFIK